MQRLRRLQTLTLSHTTIKVSPLRLHTRSISHLKADHLNLFRNGTAKVTSKVYLPRGKEVVSFIAPKFAEYGSLWVDTKNGAATINSINTGRTSYTEDTTCLHLTQLLKANISSVLAVQLGNETIIGRIDSVLQEGDDLSKGLLVIQTEKALHSVPLSRVTGIQMPRHIYPDLRLDELNIDEDQILVTILDRTVTTDTLDINYTVNPNISSDIRSDAVLEGDDDIDASIHFVSQGMYWIPEYQLALSDNERGRLTLSALVMNDMHDIYVEQVKLFRVSFKRGQTSPLVSTVNAKDLLSKLTSYAVTSPTGDVNFLAGTHEFSGTFRKGSRFNVIMRDVQLSTQILYRFDSATSTARKFVRCRNDTTSAWPRGFITLDGHRQSVRAEVPLTLPGSSFEVQVPQLIEERVPLVSISPDGRRIIMAQLPTEISLRYDIGEILGSGTFSIVKKITDKKTKVNYAMKIIDKSLISGTTAQANEVDILKRIHHQNVVTLQEVYENKSHMYLIMELVVGGELFDEIVTRGAFSEADAAQLLYQVIDAVAYLHSQGVVHRDLKPENLLFDSVTNSIVKIADFGLSKIVGQEAILKTACGTPGYVAPEVLRCEGYGQEVDMWACGVILYILLCGFPPFYDENITTLYQQILTADYEFPEEYWVGISDSAKDLVCKLLMLDPGKRFTAKQALKHPWLVNHDAEPKQNMQSVFDELKKYNSRRRFKVAISTVLATNKMSKSFNK
ncbi:calcium/calmodulin-dependent protein kinase-like protein [Planoprotostelium fungivorum]|uniref:Calcium/calmodulin-dependent protein kinase-like protein n=1 Tax=Planoprotostelium fungivorum TaxID=1890364 RepID=A0A2P6NEF1_9EUKA|nr:calcium/calmodulin-dependent protein kinase-like protein [Planoprotostelium fungivorum]